MRSFKWTERSAARDCGMGRNNVENVYGAHESDTMGGMGGMGRMGGMGDKL